LALSIVLRGSEICTHIKRIKLLTYSEIKFFRRTNGCTIFDLKRNEEILEELKEEPVDEKPRRYKSSWLREATNMNSRMQK
jgi:hypothetical protein